MLGLDLALLHTWSQVCTDTPRSDPYVLSQLHARKQAPDPSVRPRLHTTSEEIMFLFVSALADIKLSHGESQRAQRESFLFFLPPSTTPLSFFSIMLSYFSLFASSFIICTPNPLPRSPPALLSSLRIAVVAGGTGDCRQPSDCFMIYRKRTS